MADNVTSREPRYVGFWKRLLAFFIDSLIVLVVFAIIVVAIFAAGMAFAVWAPGVTTALRQNGGAKTETNRSDSKPATPSDRKAVVAMDEERIRLAQIDQSKVGPGTIARHLIVPGTILPDEEGARAQPRQPLP